MEENYYVTISVSLVIKAKKDIDLEEVINEMKYEFVSTTENVKIIDSEINYMKTEEN